MPRTGGDRGDRRGAFVDSRGLGEQQVGDVDEAYKEVEAGLVRALASLSEEESQAVVEKVQPDLRLLEELKDQIIGLEGPANLNLKLGLMKDFNKASHRIAQEVHMEIRRIETGRTFPLHDLSKVSGEHSPSGKRVIKDVRKGWKSEFFVTDQRFLSKAMRNKKAVGAPVLEPQKKRGEKSTQKILHGVIDQLTDKSVDENLNAELDKFLRAKQEKGEERVEPENQRWDGEAGGAEDRLTGLRQKWERLKLKVGNQASADVEKKLAEYDERVEQLLSNDSAAEEKRIEKLLEILLKAEGELLGDSPKNEAREENKRQRQEQEEKTKGTRNMIERVDKMLEEKKQRNLSEVLARLPGGGEAVKSAMVDALRALPKDNEDEKRNKRGVMVESLAGLARALHQLPNMEAYRAFFNRAVGEYGLDGDVVFQEIANKLVNNFFPLTEEKKVNIDGAVRDAINSSSLKEIAGVEFAEVDTEENRAEKVITDIEGLPDRVFNLGSAGQKLKTEAIGFLSSGGSDSDLRDILSSLAGVLDRVFVNDEFLRLREKLFSLDREEDADKLHETVGEKILEKFLPFKAKKGMGEKEIERIIKNIAEEMLQNNSDGGQNIPKDLDLEPTNDIVDTREKEIEIEPKEFQELLYVVMIIKEAVRRNPGKDKEELKQFWRGAAKEKGFNFDQKMADQIDNYILNNL